MTDKYKEKMIKDKYIKIIKKLTPDASAQDMEDAYGDSYKNPAYLDRLYDEADIERQRRKDEGENNV